MYQPNYHISDELLNLISQIEAVRTKVITSHILPEREIAMRYRSSVEATHSSTSIEGNPLNMKQVAKVLSDKTPLTKHQYAEIEVKNYQRALDFIDKRKQLSEKISTHDVLAIHEIITRGLLDTKRAGKWRQNPVYIENQKGEVLYTAVPASKVKREINELLKWLTNESYNIHPVIAAAIFHIQFVSIHPFADGNGRATRALTMLYLGLREYDFRRALVLDSYYATERGAYYQALQSVGNNYAAAVNANLDLWIKYFVDGFFVSANVLAAEVALLSTAVKQSPHPQKISREEADILSYISQFGSISLSEAEQILVDVPRRTVQRKLTSLVDQKLVKLDGATHKAKYVFKKK